MSTNKIKILMVAPHYNFFIKDFTDEMSKYCDKIEVLIHHNRFLELAKYFQHIFLKDVGITTKKYLADLKNKPENVNIHILPYIKFLPDGWLISPGGKFSVGSRLFKKFREYIKKERVDFDLIHAHFTWPCGYVGVKLAKEFGVPVIITIHENRDWFLREYNSKNDRIYWTWKNADAIIRVNQIDVPILSEFNQKVYSIPNGFNPNKFTIMNKNKAREVLDLSEDKKIIFSLGNLIERKGFQYLMSAMKEVVKVRKDVLCFIGGSGPLKGELEKQIKDLGLQEHVKLLGFVSDEELGYWMNAADLFVFPSLRESFGVVQIEAMACGVPVVATRNGGSEEIIISEDYGLLCEPANPKELAEKILIALEKEWDREKIRKYAEQFTWENIAKRTLEVYRGVLK